jgi:serine/threonine-protein kinase
MSTVYKAYQPSLDRLVAVKVMARAGDPQFVARFEREARSIARLQHPNIVAIYDYGEQDGQVYLAVQYVENGRTLADLLGGPMEPTRACELLLQLLAALGYAHERGVIHRDVKPGNVLMPTPVWPMLADFGIAKVLLEQDGRQLTQAGLVVGTAAYMAPEQAFGLPVDARTDLYAAGVVLYEMLTGRVPFQADTPAAMLLQHAYEPPPSLGAVNPALPPQVEEVVARALAKDPADRYANAGEMATELRAALVALQSPAPVPPSDADTPVDPLAAAYAAGVAAFTQGRLDEAIGHLSRVAAAAPGYEDVAVLLDGARQAQGATPPGGVPPGAPSTPRGAIPAGPPSTDSDPPSAQGSPRRWFGKTSWRLVVGAAAVAIVVAARVTVWGS